MDKFVDVKKLIAQKNPGLLKWIPPFVINYIRKVIHEDDLNEFMWQNRNSNGYEFCDNCMVKFNITINLHGQENIPPTSESVIFAANHPLGGFDAVALISRLQHVRPDIKFIVNDFLLALYQLSDMFVGVNKVGKNAAESLQKVDEQFGSDSATFIFPAGLVSRRKKGIIEDVFWRKTFISKAKKYHKPVIPVYIEGRLTNRFYNLSNIREFFGIKFNIEMIFLVDELFKQQDNVMNITFGEAIPPETFDKTKSEKDWSQWVKKKVYSMAKH
jgi:putative hemolysin